MLGFGRRLILGLLFASAVSGGAASSALADDPPTTPSLTGENFVGPTVQRSVNCNPDGTGYVTFSTSGPATGPYTGTFQESGVLAIVQYNGLLYENFVAWFTINSVTPSATVWGGKAEIPPETFAPPPGLTCQSYDRVDYGYTTLGNTTPNRYDAWISANGLTYQDYGNTTVTYLPIGPAPNGAFRESFVSSRGVTLTPNQDQ